MVDQAEERPVKIDASLFELAAEQATRRGVPVDDLVEEILRLHMQAEQIRPAPDEPTQDGSAPYFAFISYSHEDSSIAAEFHKRLERFPVPRTLVGQSTGFGTVPRRIRPIFRDEEEFSASADLGRSIRNALRASGSLVVLCSPRSAGSAWVGEEIRYFKQLGRAASIFCLIIDGAPVVENRPDQARGALHPALLEHFDDGGQRCEGEAPEPLAIDVRELGLDIAVVKVAAGVLNVGYEALHQRVRKQKRRRIITFTVLLAAIIGSLTGLFLDGRLQKQRNAAQAMAVVAQQQLYAEDPVAGIALALQALEVSPDNNAGLLEVARDLATRGRVAAMGRDIEHIVASESGLRLVLDRAEGNGEIRSVIDGTLQETLPERLLSAHYYGPAPGYFLLEYRLSDAELRRVDTGAVVARPKSPVSDLGFGPGHVFAQNSGGYPNQLLRLDSGAAVRFKGDARPQHVVFGSAASELMVVSFFDGHGPQVLRTSDGSRVVLARPAANVSLSQDADTSRLLVTYADGSIELLATVDFSLIRRFEPDTKSAQTWSHGSRLMSAQLKDGSRRLVDMTDGSTIASGIRLRRSRDPDRSLAAVISEARVSWYRAADASRLGEITGRFSDVRFSRDTPPSRIAVNGADGWQLHSIADGSLITGLPGAVKVAMDEHYLVTTDNAGRQLRALANGSLCLSLDHSNDRVMFISQDLALVEPEDGSPRYHALPSGEPAKVPSRRNIAFDAPIGPDKSYHLIAYTDGRTEIRDGPAGVTLAWIEGKILKPSGISFLPETAPSHILVSSPDVPSAIYPLMADQKATYPEGQSARITLPGVVARVDLLPRDNPDYMLFRYSDGSAELWSGLDDMRPLAGLESNLEDFLYMDKTDRLVLRYANGSADLIDLGWLLAANHPGIADKALFGLACDGPLRAFDPEVLEPYLHGESWTACLTTD